MEDHKDPPKKRQQRKACDTCRRRKVGCDITEHQPCSVCKRSKIDCRSTTVWQPSKRRKVRESESDLQTDSTRSTNSTIVHPPPSTNDTSPSESRSLVSDKWTVLDNLTRSGLAEFFHHGVESTDWLLWDIYERYRIAYVGTPTSNLSHLVQLKLSSTSTLHYPYPPIRPQLPWKPENGIWGLRGETEIAHDISCFPSKEIRDSLVEAFFTKIHPGFPIIDEARFRVQYANPDHPPPLLVFQAILLVGAHVCDHPMVAQSRAIVKGTIFRRASMLFHIRHEYDRLQLMQAALLFTWHLDNADTVSSGSYYWLGIACRIGFGIGLHRDLSKNGPCRMPPLDKRMYRRNWWTAYQFEIFSALEHGRPCSIDLDDIDQTPLEMEDLREWELGHINDKVQFEYCTRNIRLCTIILDILQMNRPSAQRNGNRIDLAAVNSKLAVWAIDLSDDDDFWSCQLRVHYNLVLLHLHRNYLRDQDSQKAQDSQEICNEASQAILSCFETMISQNMIGQCHFTGVMAMTAAGIHISHDIKMAIAKGSPLIAVNAQGRLARLLRCTRELAAYWPNAESVHKIFDGLHHEFEKHIVKGLRSQSQSAASQSGSPPETLRDWRTIFGALDFAQSPGWEDQDWLNSVDWATIQSPHEEDEVHT